MAVSTAKAVWSVCVPICRPLSADVKEYAQRIERPVREFVSSLRPDCKRGIDPLPPNRIRCCRRHSCRQSSADSNRSRYSGHQNRKGRRGKWGTAAMRAAQIMGCSCLRWVINGPDSPEVRLPLFPRKRTQVGHLAMSVSCQHATSQAESASAKEKGEGLVALPFPPRKFVRVN